MESIESYELQSFSPNRRKYKNLNKPNKHIEYDIFSHYSFIDLHYAYHYIRIEVLRRDTGRTCTAKFNIKLINNFVPHPLCQDKVRMHGTILDRID